MVVEFDAPATQDLIKEALLDAGQEVVWYRSSGLIIKVVWYKDSSLKTAHSKGLLSFNALFGCFYALPLRFIITIRERNYRIFLFSFQFFKPLITPPIKERELRDRLLLNCERMSSKILTNNTHSSSGFISPTLHKPFMYPIGTRIRESSSFKSLSNRCIKPSMPFLDYLMHSF